MSSGVARGLTSAEETVVKSRFQAGVFWNAAAAFARQASFARRSRTSSGESASGSGTTETVFAFMRRFYAVRLTSRGHGGCPMSLRHVIPVALVAALALPASAITYQVNSNGDAPDANTGDGICQTATPGVCTLSPAVDQANVTGGTTVRDAVSAAEGGAVVGHLDSHLTLPPTILTHN